MSVLIRGMEMPTEGEWISVNIFPDGKCVVQSWCGKDFICMEKLTAIPVPEHGDLIDKQYAYQNTMTLGEHTRKIVLKQIDALPVVIPADIKTMYYPQVDGITPTVIKLKKEETE